MVEKEKIIDSKILPTLIALGVLVVLGVLAFVLKPLNNQPLTSTDSSLLKFTPGEVKYIFLEDKLNDYINSEIVLKDDKNWYVNGNLAYTPEVMRILNVLSNVKIGSEIEHYSDLKDYKLNPYEKRLVIKFKDTSKPDLELLVGDYAPVSKQRYVKFLNDDRVFLADKFVYSAMAVTPEGLLNKDIFGIAPENLKAINITYKDENYLFEKEKEGWFVTLPNKVRTFADQNIVSNIINVYFGNAAAAVIRDESTKDLLDNFKTPYMIVKAFTEVGHMAEVKVSFPVPSTKIIYLWNVEKNKIFILNKMVVDRLKLTSFDARNKKLFIPRFSNIEMITIKKGGKDYQFTKNDKNLWRCSKLSIDEIATTSYIEDIYSLYADKFSNDLVAESSFKRSFKDPALEIIVNEYNQEKPYTIALAPQLADGYYPVKLSEDPFLFFIDKDTFKIINDMGYKEKKQ